MEKMETIQSEVRYTSGQVRKWKEDVEETRTVEFVISTSDKDRHKSVLNPQKWDLENYALNPIVGYQHNVYGDGLCYKADPDDIIGTSRVFVEGDNLIGAVTFEPAEENAFAEKIFRKVLRGTLRSASVSFFPLPDEKGKKGYFGSEDLEEHKGGTKETFYYAGQELVEWSVVNIPSNPKAQVKALRSETANALVFLKRELGFKFSDIENLRVGEVVEMLENPEKRIIKNMADTIEEMVKAALGDKFNEDDFEKLTIRGLFTTLRGGEAAEIETAETGDEVDVEARRKRLHKIKAINSYLDFKEEHTNGN